MPEYMKWAISLAAGVALVALGWKIPLVLYTVHVLLCFLLIGVVLMQSGKAADLAGAFGGSGSQTAFGPRGAATLLSKITTWCFIMFLLTSTSLMLHQTRVGPTGSSVLEKTQQSEPAPSQPAPSQPAPAQQTPPPPNQ